MTAESGTVEPPKHPLHAMTTYELCDERKRLEQALRGEATGQASATAPLRKALGQVIAEQEDRKRLTDAL
jgi:hypothetical protein